MKPRLNAISYIGTVISLVGFAITIAEIRFSIITTQTLQEATLTAINNIRSIEDASFLSECINTIDAVITAIHSNKYEISLIEFRNFRKIFCKIRPNGPLSSNSEQSVDGKFLNETEKKLIAATKTTLKSPLSNPQRRQIVADLLQIKSAIEFTNPAKRG